MPWLDLNNLFSLIVNLHRILFLRDRGALTRNQPPLTVARRARLASEGVRCERRPMTPQLLIGIEGEWKRAEISVLTRQRSLAKSSSKSTGRVSLSPPTGGVKCERSDEDDKESTRRAFSADGGEDNGSVSDRGLAQ